LPSNPYVDWSTYESSPLFDRSSLRALESDVRLVAGAWCNQDEHEAVDQFVHAVPLAYVQFDAHDRYAGSTSCEMETLFRLFVPKRMQTSEKAQAKRLLKRGKDRYETDRKLHLGDNEWHSTTLIYRRKENSEHTGHQQYSVFMTNPKSGLLTEYWYRWEIESGYKSIKRFMAATTSKNFGRRFLYFVFACLLYSIWQAVDLLVQLSLTGEYEHSPIVTADNTLTLLRKESGIG
jgi:hypothetical protein